MSTKLNPSPNECFDKAEPDEPRFTLLGRDKHAPTLVWLWSVLRELDGEKPEVVKEARECVVEMMSWAHEHGRKIVGLGEAGIAAMLELIRMANLAAKDATNCKTDVDVVRRALATTTIEGAEEKKGE